MNKALSVLDFNLITQDSPTNEKRSLGKPLHSLITFDREKIFTYHLQLTGFPGLPGGPRLPWLPGKPCETKSGHKQLNG